MAELGTAYPSKAIRLLLCQRNGRVISAQHWEREWSNPRTTFEDLDYGGTPLAVDPA